MLVLVFAVGIVALAGCGHTTVPGLHVRAQPSTSSTVVDTLGPTGTGVGVRCWTRGTDVAGHTVWYRIDRPTGGYVTSYFVDNGTEPLQRTPAC